MLICNNVIMPDHKYMDERHGYKGWRLQSIVSNAERALNNGNGTVSEQQYKITLSALARIWEK